MNVICCVLSLLSREVHGIHMNSQYYQVGAGPSRMSQSGQPHLATAPSWVHQQAPPHVACNPPPTALAYVPNAHLVSNPYDVPVPQAVVNKTSRKTALVKEVVAAKHVAPVAQTYISAAHQNRTHQQQIAANQANLMICLNDQRNALNEAKRLREANTQQKKEIAAMRKQLRKEQREFDGNNSCCTII